MFNNNLVKGILFTLVFGFFGAANAAPLVITGPEDGSFAWTDGLGSSHTFKDTTDLGAGPYAFDSLSITVAVDSILSDFSVFDCCSPGDVFDLVLDGIVTPWTTTDGGVTTTFSASVTDLFLSAGTHTIDLLTTADCCGSGAGTWTIGEVTAAVPAPGALALIALGLLGLGWSRRSRV